MDKPNRLSSLATRLARTAGLLLRETGDLTPFYDVLDEVLALDTPDDEVTVIGSVAEHFVERHADIAADAIAAVLQEFEVESEYRERLTQDGMKRGCLLFAIPFVAATESAVPGSFRHPEDISRLEVLLRDAQVIADVADFRLVPRVFSLRELCGRTFGEYWRMTGHWGDQLLAGGELDSAGPRCLRTSGAAASAVPQAGNPFVGLHFLVGVLAARPDDMPEVFPPAPLLPAADESREGGEAPPDALPSPFAGDPDIGTLADGGDWEDAFCRELARALELPQPPLAALAPSGFHEDLSAGLELEREGGLHMQFTTALESRGFSAAQAYADVYPLRGPTGSMRGWRVQLVGPGRAGPLEALDWPRLGHEDEEDSAGALADALLQVGVRTDGAFSGPCATATLH